MASLKKANHPTLVEGLKGKKVTEMSAGLKHCMVLVEEDSDSSSGEEK